MTKPTKVQPGDVWRYTHDGGNEYLHLITKVEESSVWGRMLGQESIGNEVMKSLQIDGTPKYNEGKWTRVCAAGDPRVQLILLSSGSL